MALLKTLDLTGGEFELKHTERGALLTVFGEHNQYHTYIPRVRDCNVTSYGESTQTIRVGNVFNLRLTNEQFKTTGKTVLTAALGNGWEG